jgi:hypothetical protein
MRRAIACAALTLALAGCAGGGRGPDQLRGGILRPVAQPGEVVAAELAFARAAQEKGQWTAFAQYAADDAVMYAPQPVLAKVWLKGRANPPQAVKWQPYQVWSSCDGSLAASRGAWQRPDGSVGYFTTIWQRQQDGGYKWVLDSGDKLSQPLAQPDLIQADIADCPARGQGRGSLVVHGKLPVAPVTGTPEDRGGQSLDGTLSWSARSTADGSRTISVLLSKGGAMKEIVHSQVSP